jgi:copper chaperone CopZ
MQSIDKEIKKAIESLEGGQKIQLELDKKIKY